MENEILIHTNEVNYPYYVIKKLVKEYPPSTGFYFYPASGIIVVSLRP